MKFSLKLGFLNLVFWIVLSIIISSIGINMFLQAAMFNYSQNIWNKIGQPAGYFGYHLLVLSLIAIIEICLELGYGLFDCGIIGCPFQKSSLKSANDKIKKGFAPFTGLLIIPFPIVIFLINTCFLIKTYIANSNEKNLLKNNLESSSKISAEFIEKFNKKKMIIKWLTFAVFFLFFLPFWCFLCTILPNNFLVWTPYQMRAYLLKSHGKTKVTTAEYRDAVFFSKAFNLKNNKLFAILYVDIVMFYLFIYIIVFFGVLAAILPKFKGFLKKRVNVIFDKISIGLILLFFAHLIHIGFQLAYWYDSHAWGGAQNRATRTSAEKAARTLGQISNIMLSLLILPIARNSIWSTVFEISFENALAYHRFLGYGFLATTFSHMISWWVVYNENNFFPHDILAIPMYYPNNGRTAAQKPKADNMMVPLMVIVYFICFIPLFVFTFEKIRRKKFELFYYSHMLVFPLILAALFHSYSIYYFLFPTLLLYLIDRYYNDSYKFDLISIKTLADEITELRLKSSKNQAKFLYQKGQYAFINIPIISQYQWHPFTLSSSVFDEEFTFHIKNMGKGTWTEKLYLLSQNPQYFLEEIEVIIDGPYGVELNYSEYEHIVLVAGGIGITPVHNIFKTLYLESKEKKLKNLTVEMYWTVRNVQLFQVFSDTFNEIKFNPEYLSLTYILKEENFSFYYERMNIHQLFKDKKEKVKENEKVLVFVCGPNTLKKTVSNASFENNFDFHQETFEF